MWDWRRSWRERSKLERIDLYSRVTISAIPWLFTLSWGIVPFGADLRRTPLPTALGATFLLLSLVQCLLSNRNVRPSYLCYLGTASFPLRRQSAPLALMLLNLGILATLVGLDAIGTGGLVLTVMNVPMPFVITQVLLVPVRTFLLQSLALALLNVGVFAAVGVRGGTLAGMAPATLFGALLVLICVRPSVWSMSVMWQAEEARDLQARLAVAEERLRFGRDMHDVLGRNLAVIALKSELAVELAQRGKPAAVDQMVEVMRIARSSQQEVRDVVRGYREADLVTELAGAQGVLRAAGIECEVAGGAGAELPAPVRSALGWVVREAATNVLRHGDPRHCTIRLRTASDAAVLEVENDGAPPSAGPAGGPTDGAGGSGLAGLRERLRELDGSLDAGPAGSGVFRLTARIPLPSRTAAPASPTTLSSPTVPTVPASSAPAAPSPPSALSAPTDSPASSALPPSRDPGTGMGMGVGVGMSAAPDLAKERR
ncbi:sensor histidine kinase [Streptomyces sp. CB01580]|uniref:sensor histidine kinase n=1 Tax=Streptomyces sp. CB01580 TaxID=1703933 RepID=UPI000969BC72|nr:histidine kinase [Streptomyces sp. CB01580]OKJ34560.1 histidine kinase [Streptomyces sp. CB01580]